MKLRFFTFIFSLFTLLVTFAQSDDFGMDFTVGAEKRIRPGMSFGIEGEARTQDNTRKIERWTVGGEFEMRLFRTSNNAFELKGSAGWKYMWLNNLAENIAKYDDDDDYKGYNARDRYWRNRHRTSISLNADYELSKRWSFSLKETFQYTHFCKASTDVNKYRYECDADGNRVLKRDESESEVKDFKSKDRTVLRSRLTVKYNIRHCPVNPYASVDYGCGLNYTTNKWKYTAGADINLTKSKQHKMDVFYRYQTEDDDDEPNGHLIGVGYKLKF